MTREVQVLAWCDVDMADDRRVPMAVSHEVVIDGKAFTVDLCEDHEAAVYKPFAALVAHGSAPAPKGAQGTLQGVGPGPRALGSRRASPSPSGSAKNRSDNNARVCLLCGADLVGRAVHDRHMIQAHNLPKPMALYGDACPLCARSFSTPQGLATHGANVHGIYDTAALFLAAREAGDPHQVVAAALERVQTLGGSLEAAADTLTRDQMDAARVAEAEAAAVAIRASGLRRGQRGIHDVAAAALPGIPSSMVNDRIRLARDMGLLPDEPPPLAPGGTRVHVTP